MALNHNHVSKLYGKSVPFETIGRSEQWAESRVLQCSIVGKTDRLRDRVKPGDPISVLSGWLGSGWHGNYYVRTVTLAEEEGEMSTLTVSLVLCKQGKKKPYNETWEVSMEEVQKKLISHPKIVEAGVVDDLFKWEETPKRYRTSVDKNGKIHYWFATGEMNGDSPVLKEIEDEWALAYIAAVTAGIETFNMYLPVITHVSSYLELPGVDYDSQSHQVTGGTISEFSGKSLIGNFDEPKLVVEGYTNGRWFKSKDTYSQNSDGTWTRTEQWTYTNDTKHAWIYTGKLGK